MTTILYVWWVIAHIAHAPVCTLWVDHTPTPADFESACRGYEITDLMLNVQTYPEGLTLCGNLPGTDLYQVQAMCPLDKRIDNYRLVLFMPAHDVLTCSITVQHEDRPTDQEIADQCGADVLTDLLMRRAEMQSARTVTVEPPAPKCAPAVIPVGAGLYDQASSTVSLHTEIDYTWLAGRLIWFGIVRPQCDGYSGMDIFAIAANPCGMTSARYKVVEWQNRWDEQIYISALTASVPARLLKRMIGLESQFWPLYVGRAGEMSVMQITENGADVLLRYDPILAPEYISQPEAVQFWRRLGIRNSFDCQYCDLQEAITHTSLMIPMYARMLAAYRCRAVSINPSLGGVPAWQQAAIDYNGSEDYLVKLERMQ